MNGIATFTGRFLLFAVVHSLLAAQPVRERLERFLGRAACCYRLLYNILSLVLCAWVVAVPGQPTVIYLAPGRWSLLLYLLQLVALLLMVRCARQTGLGELLGTDQIKGRHLPDQLVTSGCYGRVRHPLYSTAMLFLCANPVMTDRWLALTLLAGLYFLIGARLEERRLAVRYGQEYVRYRAEVPQFLPRIRR